MILLLSKPGKRRTRAKGKGKVGGRYDRGVFCPWLSRVEYKCRSSCFLCFSALHVLSHLFSGSACFYEDWYAEQDRRAYLEKGSAVARVAIATKVDLLDIYVVSPQQAPAVLPCVMCTHQINECGQMWAANVYMTSRSRY